MKFALTLVLLITLLGSSISAQQFVTNVVVMNGELYVNAKLDKSKIKRKLDREMKKRRLTVIENQIERAHPDSTLYVAELFITQYMKQNPIVNFVIRSKEGVHYRYWDTTSPFGSIKLAIDNLISDIFINVPLRLDLTETIDISLANLGLRNSSVLSISASLMEAAVKPGQAKFPKEFENELIFFIPGKFSKYAKECTNLSFIRERLRGQFLTIFVNINSHGKLVYKNTDSPIELNIKQENRLKDLIDAIPLYFIEKEYENLKIEVSIF